MRRPATTALALTLGLSLCLSGSPLALAATPALAEQPTANTAADAATATAAAPETDGVIVTLTSEAGAELQSLSADGDGVPSTSTTQALADAGLAVADATSTGGTATLVAHPTDGTSDEDAAAKATTISGVAAAQPNYLYAPVEPIADGTLADRLRDAGAATAATTTDEQPRIASILPANDPLAKVSDPDKATPNEYWAYGSGLVGAWRLAKADHTATVAVMDSGVRLDHEDLKANLLTDLARDVTTDGALPGNGDAFGHGTFVAGVVAGVANNGVGLAGASYNANVLPIKIFQQNASGNWRASTASFLKAYDYIFGLIDSGTRTDIRVVNISAGGNATSGTKDAALEAAIAKAKDTYRIATVCAAGNTASDTGFYPSDFDDVISVTALTTTGDDYPGADYNASKDISAPGDDIYSSYFTSSSSYVSQDGTSTAAPIVSGTLALMFAEKPDATVDEVTKALYETAGTRIGGNANPNNGSKGALSASRALGKVIDTLPARSFPDVASDDWFAGAVDFVSRRGIMTGYDDTGSFGPNDTITREQMARALYNYFGNGEVSPVADKPDVDQDAYYAKAVNWAIARGIMTGIGGTDRFGVGEPITRQQIAQTFSNLLATSSDVADPDMTKFDSMPDHATVDGWAINSVAWALNTGIINGSEKDNGQHWILPQESATRAQIATIFNNCLDRQLF